MRRDYYSTRKGINKNNKFDLEKTRHLILTLYHSFEINNYFQEYFGYDCVDDGHVPGRFGNSESIKSKVLIYIKKDLWPFEESIIRSSEDDLFDIIEYLYDHTSAPKNDRGYNHSFSQCGWHYKDLDKDFDREKGRTEFYTEINLILRDYSVGYQLTETGEIITIADKGFENLLETQVPFQNKDLESK